jgi:hypothetical protein
VKAAVACEEGGIGVCGMQRKGETTYLTRTARHLKKNGAIPHRVNVRLVALDRLGEAVDGLLKQPNVPGRSKQRIRSMDKSRPVERTSTELPSLPTPTRPSWLGADASRQS